MKVWDIPLLLSCDEGKPCNDRPLEVNMLVPPSGHFWLLIGSWKLCMCVCVCNQSSQVLNWFNQSAACTSCQTLWYVLSNILPLVRELFIHQIYMVEIRSFVLSQITSSENNGDDGTVQHTASGRNQRISRNVMRVHSELFNTRKCSSLIIACIIIPDIRRIGKTCIYPERTRRKQMPNAINLVWTTRDSRDAPCGYCTSSTVFVLYINILCT